MTLLASAVKRLQDAAGKQLEADVKRRSGTGARTMPLQVPGKSEQVVGTPWELIDAVEARFGRLRFDLAATADNCKVRNGGKVMRNARFGPGSPEGIDALTQDWSALGRNLCWLNPPYGNIKEWAAKCFRHASAAAFGGQIFFLIPASVGSNWWAQYVDGSAFVYFLSPRLVFQGHSASYPKDIALCRYNGPRKAGYECWRWKP